MKWFLWPGRCSCFPGTCRPWLHNPNHRWQVLEEAHKIIGLAQFAKKFCYGSEKKEDVDGVGGILLAQGGFLIIAFSRSDPIHTPFQSSPSITFQKAPLDCNATYFELIPWWGGTLKRETKKEGWWRTRENFQAASSSWRIICTRGDDRIISTRCEDSRNCTHTDYWLYSPEVTERPPAFRLKYFQNRCLRLGLLEIFSNSIEIFSKLNKNISKQGLATWLVQQCWGLHLFRIPPGLSCTWEVRKL